MTAYNPLLFVHVLAAMTWVGGGLTLSLMGARARGSPTSAADFAKFLPYVGIRVLMPAVLLVLLSGVAMVLLDAQWSFRQAWVLLALALFAVAFLVGAVYLSRVGIAMERAAEPNPSGASELPQLLNRWLLGYVLVLAVLVAAVADMVFKPSA